MSRILVVEDERDVSDLISLHLKRNGFDVEAIDDGAAALKLLDPAREGAAYDLVVLDWMLPGMSGLDVCKALNARGRARPPILMVTARADSADVVLGLEMGADDYVTKPFEIPVFLARVRALLRRSETVKDGGDESVLLLGGLRMDTSAHEVSCKGDRIELTHSEFKLLHALMTNRGRVLSRERLIDLVRGEDVNVVDRAIDTHVFGLRKKLGACADVIETVRGVGYRVALE